MLRKLTAIKIINLVLCIFYALHLPIEMLLYHGFRIVLFSGMFYVPLICITMAIQCWLLAQSETNKSLIICHRCGSLFLIVLTAIVVLSMLRTRDTGSLYFSSVYGKVSLSYSIHILLVLLSIQQFIKYRSASLPLDRISSILTISVLAFYFFHAIQYSIETKHITSIAALLALYFPIILILKITFWFMRQFSDTMQSLRSGPAPK